jgi:pentapeptide MXKDX repeat protein
MTKRSRIGLALIAASVGLGVAFAPVAYGASHEKKDKMEKSDKMAKDKMEKDKMAKEKMEKDKMMKK